MANLLGDSCSGLDVTFIFPDKTTVEAHRLVLCCTSSLFRRMFLSHRALSNLNASDPDEVGGKLTSKDINGGRVVGFVLVSSDRDVPYDCVYFEETLRIFLTLSEDISKNAFKNVLNFMYTGKLSLSAEADEKQTAAILDVAQTFQIDVLTDFLKSDQEVSELDLHDQWKSEFVSFNSRLFCNSSRFSDVSFCVDEHPVRAHRCVLVAHCDFMAAMLSGNFQESGQNEIPLPSVSLHGFLGFLQYLYTDDVNFERHNPIEVLKVANQFCSARLISLCEVCLEKKMETSLASTRKKSDKVGDLIELIVIAQTHNAHQLASKYLYYIAINFEEFKKKKELDCLSTDNLVLIEQQRWPPPCYLTELNAYRRTRDRESSCILM
ncbi:rho-related BTB domain-containing protein 1-like [Dendronephthya gigantea]|nr:rho-related BTB domain-containing protein 1-like [Dendronephthya gigantea]